MRITWSSEGELMLCLQSVWVGSISPSKKSPSWAKTLTSGTGLGTQDHIYWLLKVGILKPCLACYRNEFWNFNLWIRHCHRAWNEVGLSWEVWRNARFQNYTPIQWHRRNLRLSETFHGRINTCMKSDVRWSHFVKKFILFADWCHHKEFVHATNMRVFYQHIVRLMILVYTSDLLP